MASHPFIVFVDVPEGVSLGEIASHLAVAHRMAVRSYTALDPLHGIAEIEVMAGVPAGQLPACGAEPGEDAQNVHQIVPRLAG